MPQDGTGLSRLPVTGGIGGSATPLETMPRRLDSGVTLTPRQRAAGAPPGPRAAARRPGRRQPPGPAIHAAPSSNQRPESPRRRREGREGRGRAPPVGWAP
ncbi:MAG: hypothetical protein IPM99_17640 [Rubrivivax sp.]|nr:hypothetical protein [Rubrivivax sp.]